MTKLLTVLLALAAGWSFSVAADTASKETAANTAEFVAATTKEANSQQMKITIGKRVFTASLQENDAAAAFKAQLPLTLDMHDVNRNEKAFDLPTRLPTADLNPRAIRAGDLMIWNSRTLVVFYKSFDTPYSYTRLGKIEDPEGLAEALGAGDVTVTFELK